MAAENMIKQIHQKKDLLTHWEIMIKEWTDEFDEGPGLDAMLKKIKTEFINPDEAFIIGYMVGARAEQVATESRVNEIK